MEDVVIQKYKVAQLKAWLGNLGLPTSGTKAELIARLNGVPEQIRGDAPPEAQSSEDDASMPSEKILANSTMPANGVFTVNIEEAAGDGVDGDKAEKQVENGTGAIKKTNNVLSETKGAEQEKAAEERNKETTNDNGSNKVCNKVGDNVCDKESENLSKTMEKQSKAIKMYEEKSDNNVSEVNEKSEQMKREMELLQKENELLRREKMLLEKENEMMKFFSPTNVSLPTLENNVRESFNMSKDLLPEYNGGDSFDVWEMQLRNITKMYDLNNHQVRALMANKLKGEAQKWLISKADYSTKPIEAIINEMRVLFGSKESKLVSRKKFEQRLWRAGEPFVKYFNDKVAMAQNINIEKDELIDYLIDGIPDLQLRSQAYVQRFSDEMHVLEAFAKIELRERGNKTGGNVIKCYNCNAVGHVAAQCRKPKRSEGACFVCNKMDHLAKDCPDHKGRKNQQGTKNEYIREAQ